MMRALLTTTFVLTAALAQAQAALPLPAEMHGFVYREVVSGCGQAWSTDVARSTVTLSIVGARAHLHVDARIVEEAGGVAALVGDGGPYHRQDVRTLVIDWRGRVRRERGAFVIALRALQESATAPGSTITVTSRSTEEAVLRCVREEHDAFAASRPIAREHEAPVGRRSVVSCTFEPRAQEGPLPRPVRDVLTVPFFVDADAGVTTDAHYGSRLAVPAEDLVLREPGWVDPPHGQLAVVERHMSQSR
jgi:hypothetical protein